MVISYTFSSIGSLTAAMGAKGGHFLPVDRVLCCGIRTKGDSSPAFNTGNNKQNAKANTS